jgi:hypothetical protein
MSNTRVLPAHMSTLVMMGFNKNAFKPQFAAIKDKYYEMFRNKKGKGPEDAEKGAAGPKSS